MTLVFEVTSSFEGFDERTGEGFGEQFEAAPLSPAVVSGYRGYGESKEEAVNDLIFTLRSHGLKFSKFLECA